MAFPHHRPGVWSLVPLPTLEMLLFEPFDVVKLRLGCPRAFISGAGGEGGCSVGVTGDMTCATVTHCCAPAQPGCSHCVTQSCRGAREALGLLGGWWEALGAGAGAPSPISLWFG